MFVVAPVVVMADPEVYVVHAPPLLILYSYRSAAPEEPPEPAVIVALGLYPAQIAVPLAGVATFKVGFTVTALTGQVTIVVGPVALHP